MDELDFGLFAWIKKQQQEQEEWEESQRYNNQLIDKEYVTLLSQLVNKFPEMKMKDRIVFSNLAKYKQEGKNFSPAQRSVIANLFYKHQ